MTMEETNTAGEGTPTEGEHSDLLREAFRFWFNDHDHLRSPFPDYIQAPLKERATDVFLDWVNSLPENPDDEISDEMVAEKFEEILFSEAMEMVKTQDERITLQYPFLPRVGDQVRDKAESDRPESEVVDRHFTQEGNTTYLKVINEPAGGGARWSTKFELPV